MTKYRNLLIAFAISALLAIVVAGCGTSTPPNETMSHAQGSTGASMQHQMSGQSMSGGQMTSSSMKPLVAGADGTSPVAGGLKLEGPKSSFEAGRPSTLTLKIVDRKTGKPVTKFEREQTKLMHLIVVNHDFTGFQHLHPELQPDGRFTTQLTLPRPGIYQGIADFTTGGRRYALGLDLGSPGKATTQPTPKPTTEVAVDGYNVKLQAGPEMRGREVPFTFTITSGGKPYSALQPYLGAFGHLVALRKPDLAYSHVHPTSENLKAGAISFTADFPTTGTYRLYLQFRADGKVHVAPFTYVVE